MKELRSTPMKANVKAVAIRAMTEEEERRFTAAIDALLARWAQHHINSRHTLGENHVQQDLHHGVAVRPAAPLQR
jgi:hypothetical protein